MDALNWCIQNAGSVLLTGLVVVVAGVVFRWAQPDAEAAVDYEVPLPAQCQPGWKGEVLENPSLKVCVCVFVLCLCLVLFFRDYVLRFKRAGCGRLGDAFL